MMHLLLMLRRALVFGTTISALFYSSSAVAAEQVVLKFGAFQRSVPTSELTTFAKTGETSPSLEAYLALAGQNPQAVQGALNRKITVNPILLSRGLNSPVGDVFLDRVSQIVHTPAGQADHQALRSALVLSASEDNNITLIEAIQNYPTREVQIDGERLQQAHQQISALVNQLQPWLSLHKLF